MRTSVPILTLACSLVAVASVVVVAAEERPLELRITPRTCNDPCTIRVTVGPNRMR